MRVAGFDSARRTLTPELMDIEPVGPADLGPCLDDLERLTRWTFGYRPTVAWLAEKTRDLPPGAPISVVDVACGGGDMLRRIARWSRRRGLPMRLIGIDLNPTMVEVARARTPGDAGIEYMVADALGAWPIEPDFIVNALFAHHLDNDQAAAFVRALHERARRGWLINDLHRHVVSYAALRTVPRLFGMHRFVIHDGAVSVARGWRTDELRGVMAAAGVPAEHYRLRWQLPFRWAVDGWP